MGSRPRSAWAKAAYPGLSDVMNFPDASIVGDAGPVKNPSNTHIIRHAGKLLSLWEQGVPTEIAPDLSTIGEWNFDGKLEGAMTAHPRIDPRTGEMFFFSYNLFPPFMSYYAVDASGALVHHTDIDLPAPVMMHDMILTEDYAVFMDSPIVFNMEGMANGEPMVGWKPENGTRLGVMPRLGTADELRWFDVDPSHIQHFWNGWQDGNRIELSGCRFESVHFGIEAESSDTDSGIGEAGGVPACYWIDLDEGTAGCDFFDDIFGEFCRVNDDYTGVRTDCLYMSGFTRPDPRGGDFDTVVKYNTATDTRTRWYAGDHVNIGECVFAPDPARPGEDDGWIVTSLHDSGANESEVVVLDATDIEAGPVARVKIPQRMPFGFHANWFAA